MRLQVNEHARAYGQGIDAIEVAYKATMVAVEAQHSSAVVRANELRSAKARGEVWKLGRRTRIGYQGHPELSLRLAELDEVDTRDAITVARNAFAVMLHHHWEKHCDRWMMNKGNYNGAKAYAWLASHAIHVDKVGLELMRKLSNTIKHNSDALISDHPELFDLSIIESRPRYFEAALRIADSDIHRMIESLRTSGPKPESDFPFGALVRVPLLIGRDSVEYIIQRYQNNYHYR
jgi:hypothetical protein